MSHVRVVGEYVNYPYHLHQLKIDFPDTSFPGNLDGVDFSTFGVYPVVTVQQPDHNPFTHFLSVTAELIEDVWTEVWTIEAREETLATELLNSKRASMWREIQAVRDKKSQDGGFLVEGKWYHSDLDSRIKYMALVQLGANIQPGLWWKTMDGSFTDMTQALAANVFGAAVTRDITLFNQAETLKAQVDASDRPDLVDITQGWPDTFNNV
jgi:hypothetical protein